MKSLLLPLVACAALAGCADYGTVGYGPYGYQPYAYGAYDYAYGPIAPVWGYDGGGRYYRRDWDGRRDGRDGRAWDGGVGAGAGGTGSMAGPGPTAGAAPSFPGTVGTINAQIAPAPNR